MGVWAFVVGVVCQPVPNPPMTSPMYIGDVNCAVCLCDITMSHKHTAQLGFFLPTLVFVFPCGWYTNTNVRRKKPKHGTVD